jgi:hypothetical protein
VTARFSSGTYKKDAVSLLIELVNLVCVFADLLGGAILDGFLSIIQAFDRCL